MAKKQKEQFEDEAHLVEAEDLEDEDLEVSAFEDQEDLEEAELETKDNGTDAAATLRPGSSKADMMAGLMGVMGQMSKGDMIKFFELAMGQAADAAATIPNDAAAKNAGSIAAKAKPVAEEDLEAIFGGDEELSEEFKEKVSTLFEASVSAKLHVEVARIEEEYEAALEEQISDIAEEMTEKVDQYLSYMSSQWLEENKVAVEQSLRTSLAESFIAELGDLCSKYNLDLPEGQDDVIEDLVSKIDDLEESMNEVEAKNIELFEEVCAYQKSAIVEEIASELSPIQSKKFKTLAEGVDFTDADSFVKKLSHIKEGFFAEKSEQKSTQLISEEIGVDAEDEQSIAFVDPAVKTVYDVISRTAKR
jgi:hypothetical protein